MNKALIGSMLVSSKFPVIVYGSVRGLISKHREVGPAMCSGVAFGMQSIRTRCNLRELGEDA